MTPGTIFFLFPIFLGFGKLMQLLCRTCGSGYSTSKRLKAIESEQDKFKNDRPAFYSVLKAKTREALIREEVRNFKRLDLATKLGKEALVELVMAPEAEYEEHMSGD